MQNGRILTLPTQRREDEMDKRREILPCSAPRYANIVFGTWRPRWQPERKERERRAQKYRAKHRKRFTRIDCHGFKNFYHSIYG